MDGKTGGPYWLCGDGKDPGRMYRFARSRSGGTPCGIQPLQSLSASRAVIDRHTRERGVWFVRCVCRELPPLRSVAIAY